MAILVEVFSTPGCARCAQAREALKAAAGDFGGDRIVWRDVNVLEETDYAVEVGVMTPPSIAIDGELVFPALPAPAKLRAELARRLGRADV
jgi:glutaredoxin